MIWNLEGGRRKMDRWLLLDNKGDNKQSDRMSAKGKTKKTRRYVAMMNFFVFKKNRLFAIVGYLNETI